MGDKAEDLGLKQCRKAVVNAPLSADLAVISGKAYMIAQVIQWGHQHGQPVSWAARNIRGATPL